MCTLPRVLGIFWIQTLVLLCAIVFSTEAKSQTFTDVEIKAAYILKLVPFITWNQQHRNHITFCSLEPLNQSEDESLSHALAKLVHAKHADKDWTIRHLHGTEELDTCNMLYITDTEEGSLTAITANAQGQNILTLSDSARSIYHNVMLGFVTDESNHVKMEANLKAIRNANVLVSASVLELMTHVLM